MREIDKVVTPQAAPRHTRPQLRLLPSGPDRVRWLTLRGDPWGHRCALSMMHSGNARTPPETAFNCTVFQQLPVKRSSSSLSRQSLAVLRRWPKLA